MFLKNFYRAMGGFYALSNTSINIGVLGTAVKTTQDIKSFCSSATGGTYQYPQVSKMWTEYNTNGGVIIGTGDTEPTFDDYKLSGDIISTFTYTSSVTKRVDNEKATISVLYTITNTGTEAFTIREIALKMGESINTQFLIERSVLDTPVTIEPGGVGQVTYTITFTYPTA